MYNRQLRVSFVFTTLLPPISSHPYRNINTNRNQRSSHFDSRVYWPLNAALIFYQNTNHFTIVKTYNRIALQQGKVLSFLGLIRGARLYHERWRLTPWSGLPNSLSTYFFVPFHIDFLTPSLLVPFGKALSSWVRIGYGDGSCVVLSKIVGPITCKHRVLIIFRILITFYHPENLIATW